MTKQEKIKMLDDIYINIIEEHKQDGDILTRTVEYSYDGKSYILNDLQYRWSYNIREPFLFDYIDKEEQLYFLDIEKYNWPANSREVNINQIIKDMIGHLDDISLSESFGEFLSTVYSELLENKKENPYNVGGQYGRNLVTNNHWHDLLLLLKDYRNNTSENGLYEPFNHLIYKWLPGDIRKTLFADVRGNDYKIIRNVKDWLQNSSEGENNDDNKSSLIYPLNQILYGPPGTGKTYNVIHRALEIIDGDGLVEDRKAAVKAFNEYVEKKQIVFTTFHQSFSYEDFVEAIKPNLDVEDDGLTYSIQKGIFRKICEETLSSKNLDTHIEELKRVSLEDGINEPVPMKTTNNNKFSLTYRGGKTFRIKPESSNKDKDYPASIEMIEALYKGEVSKSEIYNSSYVQGILDYFTDNGLEDYTEINKLNKNKVLIIDEINRGNVSSIFGELITLIEDDKRLGSENELKLKLPYSKKEFGVPSNVYILGTMNTADRSVEALDSALRRRFSFIEMQANPELLRDEDKVNYGIVENIDLVKLLKLINRRIEILLDRDHHIGHSYFLSVSSLEDLRLVFKDKIIPLLQEYFYGDYGKISLVLGEGFCSPKKESDGDYSSVFPNNTTYDISPYEGKVIYELIVPETMESFQNAIKLLIGVPEDNNEN